MNSLAFTIVLLASVVGAQSIPALHGSSFAGAPVSLPADLVGRTGVLVVGFSRSSANSAKAWGDALTKDYGKDSRVLYYQVPLLASVPSFMRGVVLGGMRRHMTEQEKAHFVPVFENQDAWKQAARFTKGDDAYVLVLNSRGEVRWRAQGYLSHSGYSAMRQCIQLLIGNSAETCK